MYIYRKNFGTPLEFWLTTGIKLTNCNFTENVNMAEVKPDTENTTITNTFDSVTTSGGVTVFMTDEPLSIFLQNCLFLSNTANRNPENDTRPVLLKSNGHGGAIFIHLIRSSDSQVIIEGCTFENNTAEVDGGAIYLSLSDFSSFNLLTLRNNRFNSNHVEIASGGAISINSFNSTYNNTILLEDSLFDFNYGNVGGAISMTLYDSFINNTRFPDRIVFRNCSFVRNSAINEGTAVGLFSLTHVDQVGFPVYFQDWYVYDNLTLPLVGVLEFLKWPLLLFHIELLYLSFIDLT